MNASALDPFDTFPVAVLAVCVALAVVFGTFGLGAGLPRWRRWWVLSASSSRSP